MRSPEINISSVAEVMMHNLTRIEPGNWQVLNGARQYGLVESERLFHGIAYLSIARHRTSQYYIAWHRSTALLIAALRMHCTVCRLWLSTLPLCTVLRPRVTYFAYTLSENLLDAPLHRAAPILRHISTCSPGLERENSLSS